MLATRGQKEEYSKEKNEKDDHPFQPTEMEGEKEIEGEKLKM